MAEDIKHVETEEAQNQQESSIVFQFAVQLFENGALNVTPVDERVELKPQDVEEVSRRVYEMLRDQRIATMAVDAFKARLG